MPLSSLITALWHYAIVRHFTVEVLSVLTNAMNRVGLRDEHSVRVSPISLHTAQMNCTIPREVGTGQIQLKIYWCPYNTWNDDLVVSALVVKGKSIVHQFYYHGLAPAAHTVIL